MIHTSDASAGVGTSLELDVLPCGAPLWQRQPSESSQAHAAFVLYRDMPPAGRSASRVASEYGRHVRLIERWRSTHRWVDRAAAFDAEKDNRKREAMLTEAAEAGRRQARDAAAAQATLMLIVDALAARISGAEGDAELRRLPLSDLLGLTIRMIPAFAKAAQTERQAHGFVSAEALPTKGSPEAAADAECIDRAVQEFYAELDRLAAT